MPIMIKKQCTEGWLTFGKGVSWVDWLCILACFIVEYKTMNIFKLNVEIYREILFMLLLYDGYFFSFLRIDTLIFHKLVSLVIIMEH